ncbi:MAG: phage tail protein [Saccharopolyspora sp.]|uniref:phage tail protein n=1 Tax=Saccharopolyspora TaxID=1835 RepID=UPI00190D0E6B|nr:MULTISPECIES: phage tail protein [unclassified Saccharopolyspora]MBK0866977.1 phage tail protein [Saccharopolyspora sp. HNM0986]MBQ6640701.1 phage tail protein [Saccharopolyspora sp.]
MAEGDALSVHRFGVELGSVQVETVKEVSGLVLEQEVVDIPQTTPTGKPMVKRQPGPQQGGEVTITRGLDKSSEFSQWLNKTLIDGDVENARENLTIEVMDSKGESVRRIMLFDAWVSKWEGPELTAGESNAATEKATIVFERIELE